MNNHRSTGKHSIHEDDWYVSMKQWKYTVPELINRVRDAQVRYQYLVWKSAARQTIQNLSR